MILIHPDPRSIRRLTLRSLRYGGGRGVGRHDEHLVLVYDQSHVAAVRGGFGGRGRPDRLLWLLLAAATWLAGQHVFGGGQRAAVGGRSIRLRLIGRGGRVGHARAPRRHRLGGEGGVRFARCAAGDTAAVERVQTVHGAGQVRREGGGRGGGRREAGKW